MIQVGPTSDCSVLTLRNQLARRFPRFCVEEVSPLSNVDEAYDSIRNQYHSTRILAMLEKQVRELNLHRLLGLTSLDLYVPGMNFVFGEASLPGRVAVISTYRLRAKSRDDAGLLDKRVLKEAVHEIGHMLGLKHCQNKLCVMFFSEQLSDTDRKKVEFCSVCRSGLEVNGVE